MSDKPESTRKVNPMFGFLALVVAFGTLVLVVNQPANAVTFTSVNNLVGAITLGHFTSLNMTTVGNTITLGINLANANKWGGLQTFAADIAFNGADNCIKFSGACFLTFAGTTVQVNNAAFQLPGFFDITTAGLIDLYDGIATAGAGVPPIVAQNDVSSQTTNQNLCTYTPAAQKTFTIGAFLGFEAFTSGSTNVVVTYTSPDNNPRTFTMLNGLTAGYTPSSDYTITDKANDPVTIKVTGTYVATWDASCVIEEVGP